MKLIIVLMIMTSFNLFSQEFDVSNTVSQKPLKDIKQNIYKIAKREQRVRFFLSNKEAISNYLSQSPQTNSQKDDHATLNTSRSNYASIAMSPKSAGFSDFAGASTSYGLIVNPTLLKCALSLLDLIKQVGDKNTVIFEDWAIDEINIFLLPTTADTTNAKTDYKLQISPVVQIPKDPALNVQIPFFVESNHCALPKAELLEEALVNASLK